MIRPRLYEAKPETMKAPLTELFREIDVRYVQGSVETIDSASGLASFVGSEGKLAVRFELSLRARLNDPHEMSTEWACELTAVSAPDLPPDSVDSASTVSERITRSSI